MRVLLTREERGAARTREMLEALGHNVLVSPVIEIVATGASWPGGVVDAALATSAQAFAVPLEGVSPEARNVMPLYLVGARTHEAARAGGFRGAALVAPNAAGLALGLGKVAVPPKRLVYLAGRDRKPDIETALDVSGQSVETIEVYEARALGALSAEAEKALRLHTLDAVLHFSRRSADLFLRATKKAGLDIDRPAHLCLSEDVASPLREAGWARVRSAGTPDEAGLLALLDRP